MNFGSDNMGPVHPKVMDALVAANAGYALPYGEDDHTAAAVAHIREVFEAPEAAVFLVPLGTAANALALSALVAPWQAIYCSRVAHIHCDECAAPEFYTGGAKLVLVDEADAKIAPAALEAAIAEGLARGLHYVQPGAVSLTQVTERGTVYSRDEVAALCNVAKARGLPVHLDGARFANALVSLGCTAAEMTWKAGVDVVSFGGTKNGLMAVEALVFFNPEQAQNMAFLRKRAGHLFSKGRYLGAQMAAYLDGGLWLDLAAKANSAGARLASGLAEVPGGAILHPVEANMIYAALPRAAHRRAIAGGAEYFLTLDDVAGGSDEDPIPARFVCDWSVTEAEIERFLMLLRG
ncbi:MAG: beta-eliminating lyase-related protein [Pseudomonadota bacterium]